MTENALYTLKKSAESKWWAMDRDSSDILTYIFENVLDELNSNVIMRTILEPIDSQDFVNYIIFFIEKICVPTMNYFKDNKPFFDKELQVLMNHIDEVMVSLILVMIDDKPGIIKRLFNISVFENADKKKNKVIKDIIIDFLQFVDSLLVTKLSEKIEPAFYRYIFNPVSISRTRINITMYISAISGFTLRTISFFKKHNDFNVVRNETVVLLDTINDCDSDIEIYNRILNILKTIT